MWARTRFVFITLLATGLCAAAAQAAPLLQIDIMTDFPGDIPQSWNPPGVPNGGGSYDYNGTLIDPDGHWEMTWNITADADPFISAGFSILNTTQNTLTFTLLTTLPITPPLKPTSLIGGSTGGSVTDANFDAIGTVATAPGQPFYAGMIDGLSALPLYPDPNSWSVTFAGQTINIPAINAGLPGPTIPSGAVNVDIGILHQFTLTPGDRVALTSFFIAVPEPGSLGVLIMGGCILLRRSKRRRTA